MLIGSMIKPGGSEYPFVRVDDETKGVKLSKSIYHIRDTKVTCFGQKKKVIKITGYNVTPLMQESQRRFQQFRKYSLGR